MIENLKMKNSTESEYIIGKQKYRVTSYYVGDKDINEVLERLAIQKALYETNYENKNDRVAS